MRKFILGLVILIVLLLALAVAAAAWTVRQFADPASTASLAFKDRFAVECVAAANQAPNGQSSGGQSSDGQSSGEQPSGGALTTTEQADLTAICNCGADQMRDDIAASGLTGLIRLLVVEGIDAKIQRVLDSCQTTPSEP